MSSLFLLLFLTSFICLIVGLIKPTAFSRFIKGKITRKKIGLIFGIAIIAFFILSVATTDTSKVKQSIDNQTTEKVTEQNKETIAPEQLKQETSPATTNTPDTSVTPTPTPPITNTPPPNPTPTTAPQTDNQNVSPISSETISQKNAVKSAKSYLGYSAFSHDGMVAQLEYEQFSHADAVYGADNSGANWNEQAAKSAKQYMENSAFSRGSLIEQLKYEKFTQEQAEYGANAVGL